MAAFQFAVRSTYFPADSHAARLDAIGKEIDQVRAAMRLLCGTSPDDPIRRAGNMLASISAAHFDEAARLRHKEPTPVAVNASVKRQQRLLLGAVALVLVVLSLTWLSSGDDGYRDRRPSPVAEREFVRRPHSEQEWVAQTERRFEVREQ